MKKLSVLCLLGSLAFSTAASAHQFWPDDYTVQTIKGIDPLIMTHLFSKETSEFSFTLDGHKLGSGPQLVLGGQNADFPITVPFKMIKNGEVLVCSKNESTEDTLQQEVCLKIKVEY